MASDKSSTGVPRRVVTQPMHLPSSLSLSPLWNGTVRRHVSTSKIPDHIINSVREKFFLKPSELDLGRETCYVPVLLVQKSYGQAGVTGWDLVIPSNWGMAFWIALVYHGARACGLQELTSCTNLECMAPRFPEEYPDTPMGGASEADLRKSLEEKYMRYPPDKRPNFGKMRVQTPFHAPWEQLVSSWKQDEGCGKRALECKLDSASKRQKIETETDSKHMTTGTCTHEEAPTLVPCESRVEVLRSKNLLQRLARFVEELFSSLDRTENIYTELCRKYEIQDVLSQHDMSLVTVCLAISSCGIMTPNSTVSLPTTEDIECFKVDRKYPGPVEPSAPRGLTLVDSGCVCVGVYQMTRKEMKELKKERKRMEKKGKKAKREVGVSDEGGAEGRNKMDFDVNEGIL